MSSFFIRGMSLKRGNTTEKTVKKKLGVNIKDAEKLGAGKYGDVYLVDDPETKEKRALKIVKKSKLKDWMDRVFLANEVKTQMALNHPHIVRLYDYFEDKKAHYLLLEYMDGGELFDRIVRDKAFSERKAALITRNVAEALLYMHDRDYVHRDLKPENLLLFSKDDDVNLKLADFGFSCKAEEDLTSGVGTITYIAPEVIYNYPYRTEVDIWSLGVLVYTMLCGYPPFDGKNDDEIIRRILKGKLGFVGEAWDEISTEAKELVEGMLNRDQKQRFTAEQVLAHPWIKNAEEKSDEALSSIAKNMKEYRAKALMRKAIDGIKAVEIMRNLAKDIKFDDEESEEGDESIPEKEETADEIDNEV